MIGDLDALEQINKIKVQDIEKLYNTRIHSEFMKIKAQNPELTQREIAARMHIGVGKLQSIRRDLELGSPYRNKIKPVKNYKMEIIKDENGIEVSRRKAKAKAVSEKVNKQPELIVEPTKTKKKNTKRKYEVAGNGFDLDKALEEM